MASTEIKVRMQQRRDTASGWLAANPTLLLGEFGYETDTGKFKIGNGSSNWSSLAYVPGFSLANYPIQTEDIADDAVTDAKISSNAVNTAQLVNSAVTSAKLADNITIGNDLIVTNNLTVNGTTTTINSTTLAVDDKNIELGTVDTPTDTSANGGGITLKGTTDHTITWTNATDSWDFSEHVNIASSKEFKIAGTSVLNATTLGSGVVNSSLTNLGTLTELNCSGHINVGGFVDGRDIAADGTKLDGIDANATDDLTASEILELIKTVDGAGSGLNADQLDGVNAPFLRNANNINSGTLDPERIDDIGDANANIITLSNLEKGNLSNDGELSFDSSQGLLVYRTQQGVTGAAVTVLDGSNVSAGSNISISNLGAGSTSTDRITFSVNSNPTFSNVTANNFSVASGGTFTDVSGDYGSVKVTGGTTGNWKGYAIEDGAVFMQKSDNTQFGLYDDTNNHWALHHTKNGATKLYYDGSTKLQTSSAGGTLTGTWTGTVTNADTVDSLHASSFLRADNNDTATGNITFNGAVNIRSVLDFADGDKLQMGNSDDWVAEFNSNGWLYVNQKGAGIIFQDNGTNKMRLEDSGVFRPETDGTGTIGSNTVRWNHVYSDNATITSTLSVRGAIDLADNDILRFGNSDDCEMFTNGSHMYMDLNGGIGNFYIRDGTTTRYTFNDNGNFTATGTINGTFNTTNVRTAIAAGTAGQVGTYALLVIFSNSSNRGPNYTVGSSNLYYSNSGANAGSNKPSGSWRLMGRIANANGDQQEDESSVWLRYA